MAQSFIYGGTTGKTYADMERAREIAKALMQDVSGTPKDVGEGLNAIGSALLMKAQTKKADRARDSLASQIGPEHPLYPKLYGLPAYRYGTNFHPGGMAVVGEEGPEVVQLPRGAAVQPNPMTMAANPQMMAAVQPQQMGPQSQLMDAQAVQVADASGERPVFDAKLTEGQSKDVNYFRRGLAANQELEKFEEALLQYTDNFAGNFGALGRVFQDSDYQQADRAAKEVLAVILRKDTGAAVTNEEFKMYTPMYIPQPGDKPETLAAKRAARAQFFTAMQDGMGTASDIAQFTREELMNMNDDDFLKSLGIE